ncbi:hypothetical protein H7X46_08645 [Pseudonocardia sp. C8]|uniref:hypothetical protein n=1 Tax=Pseudonocardia sp. C8 TaxID=2762759 RepID=UPI001642797E|nr:hypothetical protein [Pseudonocardia sp. C8]MBC3191129.1 hypothetical protein [Pseudonocardia sp. C8]
MFPAPRAAGDDTAPPPRTRHDGSAPAGPIDPVVFRQADPADDETQPETVADRSDSAMRGHRRPFDTGR